MNHGKRVKGSQASEAVLISVLESASATRLALNLGSTGDLRDIEVH